MVLAPSNERFAIELKVVELSQSCHQPLIRVPLQRRSYADAVSDKIKLTLALPHQVCGRAALYVDYASEYLAANELIRTVNLQIHRCVCPLAPQTSLLDARSHLTLLFLQCTGQHSSRVW